jgi:hypothetical protein
VCDVLGLRWEYLLEDQVTFLLIVECHAEVFAQIVCVSNSLVARGNLQMSISVLSDVSVETVHEAINTRMIVLGVLIHHAKVHVD